MDPREKRAREIQESIRHILLHDWDPIGVADEPEAQDEYDSYIGGVYRILTTSRSEEALVQFLAGAVENLVSSQESAQDGLRSVARKLLALDVRL